MTMKKQYIHPDTIVVKLSGKSVFMQGTGGGNGPSQVRGHRGNMGWDEEE